MKLFIRIKNGQPYQHPILEHNFRQAFPNIDIDNLPSEFANFERVDVPNINVYQVFENTIYEWEGDVVKDVHHIRDMTNEEKISKQDRVKQQWAQMNGPQSWIFDEEICDFVPPTPKPNDGNIYIWDEESLSWVQPTEGA